MSRLKKSARHYRKNAKSRAKKLAYDKKYQKQEKVKAKQRELKKKQYKAEKAGKNIKGKDYDHKTRRYVKASVNRGRNEKSRVKGYKQKRRKK